MTTYFTPVGTLPELTRAKGSQVNDREAAVTAGFTGIEAAVAPTSGTASITYGAHWTNLSGATRVIKVGTMVFLHVSVTASVVGTPEAIQMTLPAGYRPAATVYCAGRYDRASNELCLGQAYVDSSGGVSILPVSAGSLASRAQNDSAFLNITFSTV